VASRSERDSLVLQVQRGTSAAADHDQALTDLCTNPDASNDQVEQCIAAFLQDGYDDDNRIDNVDQTASSIVGNNDDNDNDDDTKASDGLIDAMYNFWAAELPEAVPVPPTAEPVVEPKAKVKPWSVRSSPSGTYVLDPTTGKMKNITE
jgi:hypothetical protein